LADTPRRLPAFARPDLDHAAWPVVAAPLGFGAEDLTSEIDPPTDPEQTAVFLRHEFDLPLVASTVQGLLLDLRVDDGARVFLNGHEVLRTNLPGGRRLGARVRAPMAIAGAQELERVRHGLAPEHLVDGRNVLAVALYNTRAQSKDLAFDLALTAQREDDPVLLLRGPYLQRVEPTRAVVRYRTSRPVAGAVHVGERSFAGPVERDHVVEVSGLTPATDFAYRIGPTAKPLAHGRLRTAPEPGSREPIRVWVTGDPGTGNEHARAVRDAFAAYSRERRPDLWLTLGDNAYPSGTPADWKRTFFGVYEQALAYVPFFPALGNHDLNARDPACDCPHVLRAFTLPQDDHAADPGDYSFDWGNLHVIVLNTDVRELDPEGPKLRWLEGDLAARAAAGTADFTVVAMHHTPFSRGTHHDDEDRKSRAVREYIVPLLEAHGVDLVLSGHSHAYERSHLLLGPHPEGFQQAPGRILARPYATRGGVDRYRQQDGQGTLYVVSGSAGQLGPAPFGHPSMARSLEQHGSLVIDVGGCVLDAGFLGDDGALGDAFSLESWRCGPEALPPAR
jgi:hypothetical protein